MNNQFATLRLLEEMDEHDSLRSMLSQLGASEDSIEMLVYAVKIGKLKQSDAVRIIKAVKGIKETSTGGGVTGGNTVGGGTTDGASWDPQGPTGTGEQMATTRAFGRKRKYEENQELDPLEVGDRIRVTYGSEYYGHEGTVEDIKRGFIIVSIDDIDGMYSMHMSDVEKIDDEVDSFYDDDDELEEDAPRLAGNPSKTNKQGSKNLKAYSSVGFTKAPSAEEAGKQMKGIDVDMLWKESLEESRAYSQFKKQAATRPKDQQMHEAVKMVHKKLDEIGKLLEFTKLMKGELSEGEETMEYKHNTKKVFEKINTKVVEVYSKLKSLK